MTPLGVAAVYVAGIGLLVADLFIGSLVVGVVGVCAIGAAIYGALELGGPAAGGGLTAATVLVTWVAFRLSLRRMAQQATLAAQEGYVAGPTELSELVGSRGIAETMLRPAGFARFSGKRVDVVTRGELLDAGATVEVVAVEGARVVVRLAQVT